MADSLSRTLARFVDNLQFENLPPEVPDKIKTSLIHALLGAFLGAETEHAKSSIELVKLEEARPDGATILVDGTKATRCGAAFANSKMMHATNQSDSYRMLIHPGPCIIPAALATAQIERRAGRELVTALAAGYEVEARIAGDFIPSTQARGFRSSPVYGTLGAAVTTAKLLRLNVDQLVTTMALACTFTGGTTEGTPFRRAGNAVPRTQRHPQRHNGGPPGPGTCPRLGDGAGRRGGLLQRLYRQQSGRPFLRF